MLGIIVSIIAGLIGIMAQLWNPETGMIMFIVILSAVLVYFLISFPIDNFREKISQLNKNSNNILIIFQK